MIHKIDHLIVLIIMKIERELGQHDFSRDETDICEVNLLFITFPWN